MRVARLNPLPMNTIVPKVYRGRFIKAALGKMQERQPGNLWKEKMENLKSCPFCGADGTLTPVGDEQDRFSPECTSCFTSMDLWLERDKAVEAWNKRAARASSGWVPIHSVDDLPKEKGEYIWQHRDGRVGCGSFHNKLAVLEILGTCTAWMPLPPAFEPSPEDEV